METYFSYKKRVTRISKMMQSKPFSPEERLVKWTEFTLEHGVIEEFTPEGAKMNAIVYFNLDVIAFFLIVSLLFLHILITTLSRICCNESQSHIKQKMH